MQDALLLEIRDLRVQFPTREGVVKAVDGVDFSVKRKTTVGVVGESGSGKTVTAFAILQVLTRPGKISVMHTIGFQIIEAILLHQQITKREARELAVEMLRKVGIGRPEEQVDANSGSGESTQRVLFPPALPVRAGSLPDRYPRVARGSARTLRRMPLRRAARAARRARPGASQWAGRARRGLANAQRTL